MKIEKTANKQDDLYLYKYDNNSKSVVCKEGSCLICEFCDCVIWDYTNGPYMAICELELEMETCNKFSLAKGCEKYVQN